MTPPVGEIAQKRRVSKERLDIWLLTGVDFNVSYTFGIYDYIHSDDWELLNA